MVPLSIHTFKDEVKSGESGIYSFLLETDNVKPEGLNSDEAC